MVIAHPVCHLAHASGWLVVTTLMAATAGPLRAQVRIQGSVTDLATGRPIIGARVSMVSGNGAAETGEAGLYTLSSALSGPVELCVEAAGYVTIQDLVSVPQDGALNVHFRLNSVVAELAALVVNPEEVHAQGQTLTRLEPDAVDPRTAVRELIVGGVPGATVFRSSGQVGAGSGLLIRGVSSLRGSVPPIIYLDGVRLSTTRRDALIAAARYPGPLDFLDVADVQRVEVIRGAAAARYGADAASGVIVIFTR